MGVTEVLEWRRLADLPPGRGVGGAYLASLRENIVLAGGTRFDGNDSWRPAAQKIWSDLILVLELGATEWRVAGSLPLPLAFGVSAAWNDRLVCVGGQTTGGISTAACYTVSIGRGRVETETLPSLPVPLLAPAGGLVGDRLYVLGTDPDGATAVFLSLDLGATDGDWEQLASPPGEPVALSVIGVHGEDFYSFGGVNPSTDRSGTPLRSYTSRARRYSPDHGWQEVRPLPFPLAGGPSPAPIVGEELLVLGGDDGGLFTRNETIKSHHPGFRPEILGYSPRSDTWELRGALPTDYGPDFVGSPEDATVPPVTTGTCELDGAVIIPSGEIRPGVRSRRVLRGVRV